VTVADRSIPIRMEKKLPYDVAARFREKLVMVDAMESRQQLALWAASGVVDRLKDAWPALPEELNDRAQDSWEPLLAIADEAGADWPERARAAAIDLARATDDGVDHKVELLADVRDVFGDLDVARVPTDSLIRALVEKDPWGDWWGDQVEAGKLKSPASRLSRMLGRSSVSGPSSSGSTERRRAGTSARTSRTPGSETFRTFLQMILPPTRQKTVETVETVGRR
jgi:hypothetical protein